MLGVPPGRRRRRRRNFRYKHVQNEEIAPKKRIARCANAKGGNGDPHGNLKIPQICAFPGFRANWEPPQTASLYWGLSPRPNRSVEKGRQRGHPASNYIILYYRVLHYNIIYCIILYYIISHYIILRYIIVYYIILYYIALYYIALN